jgi:hypothetical protein
MPNWVYNNLSMSISEIDSKKVVDEDEYISQFVAKCRELEIARSDDDYCDSGEFQYESGWGPPTELLQEASCEFPCLVVRNEWESDQDSTRGYEIFHKGIVIETKEEEVDLWDENGGDFTIEALMDKIVEEGFEDDDGNEISFDSKEELIAHCAVPDQLRQLQENYELYDFACEENLQNCEERIWEEFVTTIKKSKEL